MLAPGFEWFVAWRHLRDPERRSHRTLIVGLALIALGALALLVAATLPAFLGASRLRARRMARGAAAAIVDRLRRHRRARSPIGLGPAW